MRLPAGSWPATGCGSLRCTGERLCRPDETRNVLTFMSTVLLNIALILVFILIGGVFAAAEMALVSLRDSQIRQLANRGKRGRTIARLTENPNLFLSAVQIGVTLAGFLSAAFGGATLADDLAPLLQRLGLSARVASTVALVLITILISYLSILLGELTAK